MLKKEEVRAKLLEIGIVPVVRAASAEQAVAATAALAAGGIPIAEITMTVPGAVGVIEKLVAQKGNTLIGAGTVKTVDDAKKCLDAGAQFLVTPGLNIDVIRIANQAGILIMAGALTPTEVIAAWAGGADFVKIFPCSAVGGASYIKALKGPMPDVQMVPTGGVNLKTAADFLAAGSAALGIGGELVVASALQSGKTDVITENAKQFVAIVQQFRAAQSTK